MATILPLLNYIEKQRKQIKAYTEHTEVNYQNALSFRKKIFNVFPKPGTLHGDLYLIFRTRSTGEERLKAAQRLSESYLKFPIHKKRWKAIWYDINVELNKRSDRNETSSEKELKQTIIESLFLIINKAIGPYQIKYWKREVKKHLNEEVTVNLLGQDWRDRFKEQQKEKQENKYDAYDDLIARIDLDKLSNKANLHEAEKTLLIRSYHGFSIGDSAEELGITPNNAYVKLHRARKKMKKFRNDF